MLDKSALRRLDSDRGEEEGVGLSRPPLSVPAGATDCRHVYDHRWPLNPWASFPPADAGAVNHRRLERRFGISRKVVVQPATDGLDNRVLAQLTR
jgi:hypothetical protein